MQVSGIFVGKSAPFEKLLGISSSYNHKGDDGYLTISTDQDTHALCVGKSNMNTAYIKRMNRLTTAGQAVLESLKTRQLASTNQPQLNNESQKLLSTADEIAKLAALRDAGALTDDEFQILKKKYLWRNFRLGSLPECFQNFFLIAASVDVLIRNVGVTTGSQSTQTEWHLVVVLPTPTHTPSTYTDNTDTSVRCWLVFGSEGWRFESVRAR